MERALSRGAVVHCRTGLLVRSSGIELQELASHRSVLIPDLAEESFQLNVGLRSGAAFVEVVAGDQRHVVLQTLGVRLAVVERDHPAVNGWTEEGRPSLDCFVVGVVAHLQLVPGKGAQFLERSVRRAPRRTWRRRLRRPSKASTTPPVRQCQDRWGTACRSPRWRDDTSPSRAESPTWSITEPEPARLARDGHAVGVAAESGDVLLHPLQAGDLIQQSPVARCVMAGLLAQFRRGQITENTKPVIHGHHDKALARQTLAVVKRLPNRRP